MTFNNFKLLCLIYCVLFISSLKNNLITIEWNEFIRSLIDYVFRSKILVTRAKLDNQIHFLL